MKRIYLFSFTVLYISCFSQTIEIPDLNFKAKLLSGYNTSLSTEGNIYNNNIDTNNNGEIEVNEALAVTGLKLSTSPANTNGDIYSFEGIEYFTNLKRLLFVGNQISGTFDATIFPNLIELNCSGNNLTGLTVNGLNQLTTLKFHDNEISELNTEGLESLETLFFRSNNISSIALNNSIHLKEIYIDFNNITTLDLSILQELESISCSGNDINQLLFNNNPALTYISASGNKIETIDLTGLSSLNYLNLSSNLLSQISVNVIPQLTTLEINSNPLEQIDLQNNTSLEYLFIVNTLITAVDCSNTSVSILNASNNPYLTFININNNIVSYSDPDLLYYAFNFENLPELTSICLDLGEQNNLVFTDYNMNENVIVYTGENCDVIAPAASINDYDKIEYKLYPNPVSSILNIENTSLSENTKLEIYNSLGQLVKVFQYSDSDYIQINVSDLQAGTYIIKIYNSKNVSLLKILKI
ncbi:MAG: hypothetical protein BM557_10170 [Flavobacterium sp. MedPE-SWcel]|uniref:T9SS type A sorting domain-containing protein n=1 Tax=uncultured Flavobacterium sp. TaxID=165435 RepID=UPI000921DE9D|nr:T9SS type A sorting domain-containing protein [uncultured Flavobacterium sp.]OIQ16227.1 MAG: hypothetical protein BM557_10170 [Flavobacterium sp. MedPE-SWcel]